MTNGVHKIPGHATRNQWVAVGLLAIGRDWCFMLLFPFFFVWHFALLHHYI